MNFLAKVGVCFLIIIVLILSLGGLASFSLEIAKIALFNQTNGELKLHPMDYVYLTALFLGMNGLWCCRSDENNNTFGIW
ncbi:hypothetical protein C1645_165717 [Glomus cerebriforme]|uniref:Uncharacterized protein n=1 Tax=Glomus cerebriforme TaxID=658196 RepID=A0A397TNV4_9GLOM|nr:hypothetical protein C1645_165717 [Glomus cerebriforme]